MAQPMLDQKVELCIPSNALQNSSKILARLEDEEFLVKVRELIIRPYYWNSRISEAPEVHALAIAIKNMRLRKLL
jgi:hypothetical protein